MQTCVPLAFWKMRNFDANCFFPKNGIFQLAFFARFLRKRSSKQFCCPDALAVGLLKRQKSWKNGGGINQSLFVGKGMRQSTFQWKKGFSVKRGEAIQWIRGLVRISTRKAIQWRGSSHSLNRRTLKIEKLLSSTPSRKSTLNKKPRGH